MEAIKLLGMSVCVTAVCAAIFTMLVPDSKLQSVLKISISLFFLLGLVSPFVGGDLQFDFSGDFDFDIATNRQAQEMAAATNDMLLSAVCTRLQADCQGLLEKEGYTAEKVIIDININEKNSISINRVTVYTDQNGLLFKSGISQTVEEYIGIGADVQIQR